MSIGVSFMVDFVSQIVKHQYRIDDNPNDIACRKIPSGIGKRIRVVFFT